MSDHLIQLCEEYRRMRAAQKDYFSSRTQARLDKAKALEARLDKAVDAILGDKTPPPTAEQGKLL